MHKLAGCRDSTSVVAGTAPRATVGVQVGARAENGAGSEKASDDRCDGEAVLCSLMRDDGRELAGLETDRRLACLTEFAT